MKIFLLLLMWLFAQPAPHSNKNAITNVDVIRKKERTNKQTKKINVTGPTKKWLTQLTRITTNSCD